MDYKVEFTDTFLDDLEKIVAEIARANPSAARRLGEVIVDKAEALAFFPHRYPRVRQRRHLRRYVVARYYKVFYRVLEAPRCVEILRCWDARRGSDPATGLREP